MEHGNILIPSAAPDYCGPSWISPYPVSENESTAGPAEGISADRHKAEPFVQNTQGHLGAAELLKNMFLAEHSVDGTACSFQLTLLFNAVRFLDQVLEQYLFEIKLPPSLKIPLVNKFYSTSTAENSLAQKKKNIPRLLQKVLDHKWMKVCRHQLRAVV